ncbi:MAG: hypothetical protein K9H64_08265 [Bacteroidales bacterium]|nr:hypothetical protein [Bacteroidales bacterium]MCF8455825.1 hypothetical protein [Bacteroidales bacterium]
MKLLSILSILILFIFIVSCKSGDEDSLKNGLLVQNHDEMFSLAGDKMKGWAIESYVYNGKDILPGLDECLADNLDVYFSDHRFESVEGNKKCNDKDPYITETGHWYFNEDSTEIEVSTSKDFYILKLIEISSDKLHYRSCTPKDTIEAVLRPANL